MSLTGILLDVSASMRENIGSGTDEEGGPWVQSIFNVIDDLIENDVTSEDRVFAIGVGANRNKHIFDIISTIQEIENKKRQPATPEHINQIFDILEKNGARNIRNWANDIALIQKELSDYLAAVVLRRFESDEKFLKKFVDDILPPVCRDKIQPPSLGARVALGAGAMALLTIGSVLPGPGTFALYYTSFFLTARMSADKVENATVSAISFSRHATSEEIKEVIEKTERSLSSERVATSVFLKNVATDSDDSIFSVSDASRIIRGCVGEEELSTQRQQELLKNVEPYIYGRTPLFESLKKTTELFQRVKKYTSVGENRERDISENKLLFVLSDGHPTDGNFEDKFKVDQATSMLKEAGVKIVSCFITRSETIDSKRLYDEMPDDWGPEARFLFRLSSEVATEYLPRALLLKRDWTIDVANNETRLFLQVNHPDHLREACRMARDVVCRPDALSDLLVSIDLDIYINRTKDDLKARDQGNESTCYAYASATVLDLAIRRILRPDEWPNFDELLEEMIKTFGKDGANTEQVLQKMCSKYRLHSRKVSTREAKEAIIKKRPVVAIFRLTENEWDCFDDFYYNENTRSNILTQKELDISKRPKNSRTDGHAVVLTSFNSKCLTFMNSMGDEFGNKGFFRVQNADVLGMKFFDVYWKLDELTEEEKKYYKQHKSKVAEKLMKSAKGLQNAEYTCPECQQSSSVNEFTGTLSKVRCPECQGEFSTKNKEGNVLALNIYLMSLSQ